MCVCGGYTLLHYLSICGSHLTAVARTHPTHPLLHRAVGAAGAVGARAPARAEEGSTAVLSLWLPAPSPPPRIMNNGGEKYIYLLIAPAPWLRAFSLAQTAAETGPGSVNVPPPPTHRPPCRATTTPPVIVSAPFEVGRFLVS